MTNTTVPPADYITVAEVAARLALSKMTVYRLCASGELPSVRVGRTYRIPRIAYELKYGAEAATAPAPAAIHPGQCEIPA